MNDFIISTMFSAVEKTAMAFSYAATAIASWKNLDGEMPKVTRAHNKVRQELCDAGLLADGIWLDQIPLYVAVIPSLGEAGYVFDDSVPWYLGTIGFEAGAIYLPADLPSQAYVPGGTLTDTIRHECAHSWRWLDPEFFDEPWFSRAFGSIYTDSTYSGGSEWIEQNIRRRDFNKSLDACRTEQAKYRLIQGEYAKDFVSDYAGTQPCEDFAETFRHYLRYRNSLDRFKPRTGVYKKLKAVGRAISTTRRQLGL